MNEETQVTQEIVDLGDTFDPTYVGGMSTGTKVGIGIGLGAALGLGASWIWKKIRSRKEDPDGEEPAKRGFFKVKKRSDPEESEENDDSEE